MKPDYIYPWTYGRMFIKILSVGVVSTLTRNVYVGISRIKSEEVKIGP